MKKQSVVKKKKPAIKKSKPVVKKNEAVVKNTSVELVPITIVSEIDTIAEDRRKLIEKDKAGFYNRERIGLEVPEYRKNSPTKENALSALDTLREFVFSKGMLEKDIRDRINEVLNDHSNRIKMYLVGISRLKIDNLYNLAKDIDRAETELVSRDFERIDTETLIALFKTLTAREKELIDFISAMPQSNLPGQLDDREEEVKELVEKLESRGISVPNVAGRRNVTSLLDKVLRDARLMNSKTIDQKKK